MDVGDVVDSVLWGERGDDDDKYRDGRESVEVSIGVLRVSFTSYCGCVVFTGQSR